MKTYERKIVDMALICFNDYMSKELEKGIDKFLTCMRRFWHPQGCFVDKELLKTEILSELSKC